MRLERTSFCTAISGYSRCRFFNKEQFEVVLAMDGRHDVDRASLTEVQQKLLDRLLKCGAVRECAEGEHLDKWQEYKCYPAMHKSETQWSVTGRCNYNCRHCFMSVPDYKGEDLTLEQCVYILDELKRCGIRRVGITGGEALVHPPFLGYHRRDEQAPYLHGYALFQRRADYRGGARRL